MKFLGTLLLIIVVLFALLVVVWILGHIRGFMYNAMNIAANVRAIAYQQIYDLCENCNVTVHVLNEKQVQVTVTKNVYSDGKAHIFLEPAKCISIVKVDFSKTYTLCSEATWKEFTVEPGKYYMQPLPTKPAALKVESTFSWVPFAIALLMLFAVAVYFAYTKRR